MDMRRYASEAGRAWPGVGPPLKSPKHRVKVCFQRSTSARSDMKRGKPSMWALGYSQSGFKSAGDRLPHP